MEHDSAEPALLGGEERFRLLAEAAPFGLSVMQRDRTFQYLNPKFTEIFGYTREDVPDKDTWFSKAYPDETYRHRVMLAWNEDTMDDVSPGEVSPRIFVVRCKDGSDKVIQFRAVVMEEGWQILTYEDVTLLTKNQQALQESETKYRTLFESAYDAIFIMQGERFIDCNARAQEMFGCYEDKIIGQTIVGLSEEIQQDGVISSERALKFVSAASEGYNQFFEWQFSRYNGSLFDSEVSLSRMDLSGETLLLAVVRDITERRRADEALREKEQMLRNILAASPVGICRVEERKFSWVNDAMIKIFGYDSQQDFIGKTAREIYASDEEYGRAGAILYAGFKSGTESETYAKFVRKDGTLFDGHVKISAPDASNRMKGTIAAFSDISRIREAERALEKSERRYRTLVEQVPDVIFSLDSEGYFTFVNSQAEKFLGYLPEQMLGKPLWDYCDPECRVVAQSILKVSPEAIWDEEMGIRDASGLKKWVRIRCSATIDDEGKSVGFEGVLVDTTAKKKLEEKLRASQVELLAKIKIIDELYAHMMQSEKSKAIAEHTAEVAHELRQPLTIIGGFARRMAKHFENPDIPSTGINKEWFQIIITEVQRLEKILRGLIDFTRHEDIRLEKVDPNRLIEDVLTIHKERFREKDLVLETNLGNHVGEILVDPNRFQQVIRNLVSNAIEASRQNGVIRIDTDIFVPSDKEQETGELNAEKYFEMKIQNGGRIIPPDELQKFFDPFYTTKEYGIGIGLTLVKRIVENHNGSISVKSEPSGTVFTLWLPVNPLEIEHGRSVAQEKVQAGS